MEHNGKLIIISAPSGAGKTSIVKSILSSDLHLDFSISACSRPKREGEIDGKDYYFLDLNDFKKMIQDELFVEWEEVYENNFYGTLKSEVSRIWKNAKDVVFDIDVKGGINIKKQFPEQSLSIFIMPPSIQELENRLRKRGTETDETIQKRISKANYEISFSSQFDKIIVNDVLEDAIEETYNTIKNFIK